MNHENWQLLASSWSISPWVAGWLLLTSLLYIRGWLRIRARIHRPADSRFSGLRLTLFQLGLLTVFVAIQSPLDTMASFSLQAHMVQHLLLILLAPPLLLAAAPMLPMIAGLPQQFRTDWLTPVANWSPCRRGLALLFHPLTTWIVFVVMLWSWHAPQAYELALRSTGWHRIEHACFLISALLFWFPVMRPYPFRPKWSTWLLLPYLVLAGIQGTALAGILSFADKVLYAHYAAMPSLFGLSPLVDQSIAGAIMWVPMSITFLVALVCIVGQQFAGSATNHQRKRSPRRSVETTSSILAHLRAEPERLSCQGVAAPHLPAVPPPTISWMNRAFKARSVRRCMQMAMLLLAAAVIVDGFLGPQVAPLNLAGVLPWIHWRGLLVIALVCGGNFFCMVCPFTSIQSIARPMMRRIAARHSKTDASNRPGWRWPGPLRNKWTSIALLLLFFWAYECFALWDRPFATAGITVGFLVAAGILNGCFEGAPFCKFVCPIGQFNFVQSLFSPTSVATVSNSVCAGCTTRDCIAGNNLEVGCQLELFQPKKIGNMDCTYCFDCSDACPHENVALVQVSRGSHLDDDPLRSGVGRLRQRFDIAVLIVLLFSAALVNAAWMTSPVLALEDRLVPLLRFGRMPTLALGMFLALCLVPATLMFVLSKWDLSLQAHAPHRSSWSAIRECIARRAPALIPLGLAMWLAHYTFHLVTTWDSAAAAFRRAFAQLVGRPFDVTPVACACCKADGIAWLLPLEFAFLAVGLCGSFAVLFAIVQRDATSKSAMVRSLSLWSCSLAAYYIACLWVLLQPMQMRGSTG